MDLRGRNKISPDFSVSSMTDIVFLLLIFFMLTSTMVSTNVLNLELPKANGTPAGEVQKDLVISINNNGDYFIDKAPIVKENLEGELKTIFQGKQEPAFILQAEEKTFTKDIVYVMDIANRNHYKMVLATEPNE